MSLGKLLATGRSLASGPAMGRYNVSERNRLPKFGAAKNPFAQPAPKPAAETVPVVGPAPVQAPMPAVATKLVSTPFSPAALKETQRIPQMVRPDPTQRFNRSKNAIVSLLKRIPATAMAVAAKVAGLGKNFFSRVKRVRRKEPQSVIPRYGKPAVMQGELSLDNVRVVRNDLEESDLEIVTAQTDTSTQVAPTVAPATPNRGPVPPALKKLTNRILGVKLS